MAKGRFVPDTYKRVEKRKRNNHYDREAAIMRERAKAVISFGTFTWRKPKPSDHITHFTLALSKPIRKDELYSAISEALGDHWVCDMTKSVSIHVDSLPWHETRKRLVQALKPLLLGEDSGGGSS